MVAENRRKQHECWQSRQRRLEYQKENFGGNCQATELKNFEVLTSICHAVMPSTRFL